MVTDQEINKMRVNLRKGSNLPINTLDEALAELQRLRKEVIELREELASRTWEPTAIPSDPWDVPIFGLDSED